MPPSQLAVAIDSKQPAAAIYPKQSAQSVNQLKMAPGPRCDAVFGNECICENGWAGDSCSRVSKPRHP